MRRGPCLKFYLPKIFFVVPYWLSLLMTFGYVTLKGFDDPAVTFDEQFFYDFFWYGQIVVGIIFLVWLLVLVVKAFWGLRNSTLRHSRLKFFATLTTFTILAIFATTFGSMYSPIQTRAAVFLALLVLYNLYVILITIFYMPVEQLGPEHEKEILERGDSDDEVPLDNLKSDDAEKGFQDHNEGADSHSSSHSEPKKGGKAKKGAEQMDVVKLDDA